MAKAKKKPNPPGSDAKVFAQVSRHMPPSMAARAARKKATAKAKKC